jgi:hypothetical protein
MNNDELFQKLTELFSSKIDYDGEFYTLFLIEEIQGKIKINFLNKHHYHYILINLKNEILKITGSDVEFSYLKMNTSPVSLKAPVHDEPKQIIKPAKIKPKEKIELPTIKNRTLDQVQNYMSEEYEKLWEKQKKIIKENENYLDNIEYFANWGQMQMIANLYVWMKSIRDYEED